MAPRQARCSVALSGYVAVDREAVAWFAPDASLRITSPDCPTCEGRVEHDGGSTWGFTTAPAMPPPGAIRSGKHVVRLARNGAPCAATPIHVTSAAQALEASIAEEEREIRRTQDEKSPVNASHAWERAAETSTARQFPSIAAKRLRNAAYYAHRARDLGRMLALLRRSQSAINSDQDPVGDASQRFYQGLYDLEALAFTQSRAHLEQAALRAEQLALPAVASAALEAQGLGLERAGRYGAALKQLARAHDVRDAAGLLTPALLTREAINEALVRLRRFDATPDQATAATAESALKRAHKLAVRPADRADTATNLAWFFLIREDGTTAQRWLDEALANDPHGEGYTAGYRPWLRGRVLLLTDELAGAEKSLAQALRVAQQAESDPDLQWLAEAAHAEVLFRRGSPKKATAGFKRALQTLFARDAALSHASGRASLLLGHRQMLEAALRCFADQAAHEELLWLIERTLRARRRHTFVEHTLEDLRGSPAFWQATRLVAEAQQRLKELHALSGLLPADQNLAHERNLREARAAEVAAAKKLDALLDAAGDHGQDSRVSLASVREALRPHEALVALHTLSSGERLAWLLTRRGPKVLRGTDLSLERLAALANAKHLFLVQPLEGDPTPKVPSAEARALLPVASLSMLDSLSLLLDRGAHTGVLRKAIVFSDSRSDLPYALREGEHAARMLSAPLVRGKQVTRAAVLQALAGHDLVHFSGHARGRSDHPAGDALLLSDDGSLSALELSSLDRVSRTVVLSVCRERAAPDDADESRELAEAFLLAGASSVVATRRVAVDAEAERVISLFFKTLTEVGPAEALRRAALALAQAEDPAWDLFYVAGLP